jgi:uncharacterized oligopeptide transporter (OPT) family protein
MYMEARILHVLVGFSAAPICAPFAGVVVSSTSLVEKDWCTGAIVSMKKLIGKYLSMALPHCYSIYKNNR